MKTKIFILITLLLAATAVSAQTFLYTHNRTHTGQDANSHNTFTFRSTVSSGDMVLLHNVANTRTNAERRFRNGQPLTQRILLGQEQLLEPDNWTWNRTRSIVNNAFSAAEKQRVRGSFLTTSMVIDTNTGRVVEVEFHFLANSGFATIPVSVYRRIELELKNQIWFTPTAVGRSLNFTRRTWTQEVR